MTKPLLRDETQAQDIDMDRIVADPDYRRIVVFRLKRERLLKAQAPEDESEFTADED